MHLYLLVCEEGELRCRTVCDFPLEVEPLCNYIERRGTLTI